MKNRFQFGLGQLFDSLFVASVWLVALANFYSSGWREDSAALSMLGRKVTSKGYSGTRVSMLALAGADDVDLSHVVLLGRLQHLDLHGGSKCSPSGFAKLSGLKNLKTINFYDVRLTDNAILELQNLASLERINFIGTLVTESEIAALRKARPDCQITRLEGPRDTVN